MIRNVLWIEKIIERSKIVKRYADKLILTGGIFSVVGFLWMLSDIRDFNYVFTSFHLDGVSGKTFNIVFITVVLTVCITYLSFLGIILAKYKKSKIPASISFTFIIIASLGIGYMFYVIFSCLYVDLYFLATSHRRVILFIDFIKEFLPHFAGSILILVGFLVCFNKDYKDTAPKGNGLFLISGGVLRGVATALNCVGRADQITYPYLFDGGSLPAERLIFFTDILICLLFSIFTIMIFVRNKKGIKPVTSLFMIFCLSVAGIGVVAMTLCYNYIFDYKFGSGYIRLIAYVLFAIGSLSGLIRDRIPKTPHKEDIPQINPEHCPQ